MISPHQNIVGMIKIVFFYLLVGVYQLPAETERFEHTEGQSLVASVMHVNNDFAVRGYNQVFGIRKTPFFQRKLAADHFPLLASAVQVRPHIEAVIPQRTDKDRKSVV